MSLFLFAKDNGITFDRSVSCASAQKGRWVGGRKAQSRTFSEHRRAPGGGSRRQLKSRAVLPLKLRAASLSSRIGAVYPDFRTISMGPGEGAHQINPRELHKCRRLPRLK